MLEPLRRFFFKYFRLAQEQVSRHLIDDASNSCVSMSWFSFQQSRSIIFRFRLLFFFWVGFSAFRLLVSL